ncbi:hypothetical protein JW949_02380, partial [Candidatus Woesearchaeota archaeon]|nr:hypothetical protein [Candidatus Woesearchaeota archaeon]
VDFFEEFPNDKNLAKLKLVDFPSVIYVASKSLKEFNIIKKKILKINSKVEVAYWPILEKSYYISPFSYTSELKELYNDLIKRKKDKPLKILIDLELPFLNIKLFLLNLFSFFRNKKLIKRFFADSEKLNIEILTAEYPVSSKIIQKIFWALGVSYPVDKYPHKKIIMFYSSMVKNKFLLKKIKQYIRKCSRELGKNLQIGLGTIAIGILGNEPILTPENLDSDLSFCKEQKIDAVVIFRLGGLNNLYIKKIKKYL